MLFIALLRFLFKGKNCDHGFSSFGGDMKQVLVIFFIRIKKKRHFLFKKIEFLYSRVLVVKLFCKSDNSCHRRELCQCITKRIYPSLSIIGPYRNASLFVRSPHGHQRAK